MTTVDGAHRIEIDQVPTWFVSEPPPRLVASLSFRVGQVDQQFVQAGWIPLLLEMALRIDLPAYLELDAQMGLATTTLTLAGPPNEVGTWMGRLASRLTRLGMADFTSCVEAARREPRRPGGLAEAMYWRYGFTGPGSSWFDPPVGPWTATIQQLSDLATRVFSRGNAALALDGPPPGTLRLPLPEGGERLQVPMREPLIALPASHPRAAESLLLTGVVPRSTSARLATQILGQRVMDRLRHGEGISYSPQADYIAMGNEAVLSLAVDVRPGAGQQAVDSVAGVVDDLAHAGPTAEEVSERRLATLRTMDDPRAARAHAFRLANEELLGRSLVTAPQLRQEVEDLSADEIASGIAAWHASGLLGLPKEAEAPPSFPLTPVDFDDPPLVAAAAVHARRSGGEEALQRDHHAVRLTISDKGVTIPYHTAVGYLAWGDGRRELLDREGRRIIIEPALWVRGWPLVKDLDDRVDPAVVVRLPARPAEEIPRSVELDRLDRSIDRHKRAVQSFGWLSVVVLAWFVAAQIYAITDPNGLAPADRSWEFLLIGLALAAVLALPTPFLAMRLSRLRKRREAIS
ncbi:MAG: hypothetical protein KIT69_15170 [Propionibacteriaceae bacterium]|nr:hypothetical protein [Propionibacteriaceae bacterium]